MKNLKILLVVAASMLVLTSCYKEQYKKDRRYQLSKKDKQEQDYRASEANKVVDKNEKERDKEERKALKERNKEIKKEKQVADQKEKKNKKKLRVNTGKFSFY